MENSKVSTKLTIGFSLVMILLGLIAALGLWGMSSIQGQLHDITRINNVESKLANQMADSVRGGAISIRNLALVTGPNELENEFARLKAQDEHYANAYAALGRMFAEEAGTTAKEHEMYAALRAEEQAVTPLMARAVALARANDTQAVTTLLIQELRPKVTTWLNRLIALSEFEEALNDQAATDAEATYDKLRTTVLAVSALALLSGVVAAVLITRSILGQLGGEPSQAQYAAGEIARGNLTVALDLKRGDQSSLMASLEKMRSQLNDVVLGIKTSAESIATAAGEIAQGNVDLSRRTEEQAASLEETASSMEEITSTVEQNTHNAHQGSTLAQSASVTAQKGGDEVETVIKTMGDISESSKKVTEIITVVEAIAFQTNILALNAAVEAARAGEQGRGFAVVASEVRTLAQRSANAAKEIKDLISTSAGHVAAGLQRVSDTGKTMEDVVRSVQSVTDLMSEISAASNEQSSGIAQINVAISQMDEVTQQNAALVEQATAAAEAMAAQADRLREAVAVFQVSPASNLVTLQSAPLSVKNEARTAIAAAAAPRRIGAGKRIEHEEKEWQSF